MKKEELKKKLTTEELEAFVKQQELLEAKSSRDSIIMWSLLLIGIAGLFIVLQSNNLFHNSKNESIAKDKINTNKAQIPRAKAEIPAPKNKPNKTAVHIQGVKEASELIRFTVDGYQKNADYKFDFGDGVQRVMNASTVKHAYREPGTYNVKLIVSYNKQTKVLYQKPIVISESIEVPDGAFTEMKD